MGNLFLLPILGGTEDTAPHAVAHLVFHACFDIVLHRHGIEQTDVLKGSGNACLVDLHGVHAMGVLAVQQDGSLGGLIHLGQQVKNRGFSRAVGADEAGNLRPADGQVEIVHGLQAAKLNPQVDTL